MNILYSHACWGAMLMITFLPSHDLAHYLVCPIMRQLVLECIDGYVSDYVDGVSLLDDTFKHLGTVRANLKTFYVIQGLFYAYHAIKHMRDSSVQEFDSALAQQNFSGSFCAALRDRGMLTADSGATNFADIIGSVEVVDLELAADEN